MILELCVCISSVWYLDLLCLSSLSRNVRRHMTPSGTGAGRAELPAGTGYVARQDGRMKEQTTKKKKNTCTHIVEFVQVMDKIYELTQKLTSDRTITNHVL